MKKNTTVVEPDLLGRLKTRVCGFFDMISAVCFGAGESSDEFDLSGLIQALAEQFWSSESWCLDVSEILKDLHILGSGWTNWTASCPERVHSWFFSLHEVFCFFKRELTERDLVGFLAKYCVAALADLGEDFLKYQTNYVACRLFKQTEYPVRPTTLPVTEKDGFLFTSQYRWLFHRLRNASKRLQIGYSLIQFKRGCKPVSVLKRLRACAKHAKALGRTGKGARELSPWIKEVKRTVREILGEKPKDKLERLLPPSTSAHYNYTRAEYGALPRLRELARPHVECMAHTDLTFSIFDCSCHKWLIADLEERVEPVATSHVEMWSQTSYYAQINYGCTMRNRDPHVDAVSFSAVLPSAPEDLKERLFTDDFFAEGDVREHAQCEVHLVLEPFKVRTITTGSPLFGWLGRFWQKKIHTKVGQHPMFEYTHSPVSFGSIRAAFGSVPSDHEIVSGDYEAATDNIEMELTKAAWHECVEWLYSDDVNRRAARDIGDSMLSGQNLRYYKPVAKLLGKRDLTSLDDAAVLDIWQRLQALGIAPEQEQHQGQLMGCILSFFLLCMINGTTCRVAFEQHYKRRFRLAEIPAKINGDDILFHAVTEVVENWKRNALICGLKPSLGKNFVSREFAMINSEMYRFEEAGTQFFHGRRQCAPDGYVHVEYDAPEEGRTPARIGLSGVSIYSGRLEPTQYIPYLNLGLLTGSGRVQEDSRMDKKFISGDDRTESVGARARGLVLGWSTSKGKRLISRFVALNRDVLESTTRGWGIPEALGGLGIPFVSNHSVEGRVVAAYLDKADPALYKREVSMIKGVALCPPPFVVKAIELQAKCLKVVAKKRWGTMEESKNNELPLLVGATWLCDYEETNPRQAGNPESCYRHLVRKAINSGVRAMSVEQLESLRDKVVVYDFDSKVKNQMEDWIPSINHRIITS